MAITDRLEVMVSRAPLALVLAAAALAACGDGGSPRPDPAPAASGSLACADGPERSRWIGREAEYRPTATFGTDHHYIVEFGGLERHRGRIFVFDAAEGRVLVADARGDSVVAEFGSSGKGPGEFSTEWTPFSRYRGGRLDWLAATDSSLLVFDGWRVQAFTWDGAFEHVAVRRPREHGLTPFLKRIAHRDGRLLFAGGGYDVMASEEAGSDDPAAALTLPLKIRELRDGRSRSLLSMELVEPPIGRRDVPVFVPGQAVPVWAAGPCVWVSDGRRPWLYAVSPGGDAYDSLAVPVEDAGIRAFSESEEADAEEMLRSASKGAISEMPEPTAVRRIRDLAVDPDGFVWVLPGDGPLPGGGVETIVLDPSTGTTVRDTLPAFPVEFGEPGAYYAVVRDSLDRQLVRRYELGGS